MSTDRDTLAAYDAGAEAYATRRYGRDAEPGLVEFVAGLRPGGHLLDIGCGPGDSARRFLDAGFSVDAVDAAPSMVECAQAIGVPARLGGFDDIDGVALYDGIWASYSLLHVPRAEVPGHLARMHRALKPGGRLHLGMKLGTGEVRDRLGRLYVYYGEDELRMLIREAGFTATAQETQEDVGLDGTAYRGIWIHADG